MSKTFSFKCSKCNLSEDDNNGYGEYFCKHNDTEMDFFADEEPEMLKIDGAWVRRFTAFCDAEIGYTTIYVDQTEFYNTDSIYNALGDYLRQIDLDDNYFSVGSVLDGNGRYKDVFVLNNRIIGYWLDECIKEIDKAKAGQPYGKSNYHPE